MKPVILIVDDQADIRQLLSGVLTDEGHDQRAWNNRNGGELS